MSPGAPSAQTLWPHKPTSIEPQHKRFTDGRTDGQTDERTDGGASRPSRGRPPTKQHRQRTVFEEEAAQGLTPRLDGRQEILVPTDDVIIGPS